MSPFGHPSLPRPSAADCWLSNSLTPPPACQIQNFTEYHCNVPQRHHWSPPLFIAKKLRRRKNLNHSRFVATRGSTQFTSLFLLLNCRTYLPAPHLRNSYRARVRCSPLATNGRVSKEQAPTCRRERANFLCTRLFLVARETSIHSFSFYQIFSLRFVGL